MRRRRTTWTIRRARSSRNVSSAVTSGVPILGANERIIDFVRAGRSGRAAHEPAHRRGVRGRGRPVGRRQRCGHGRRRRSCALVLRAQRAGRDARRERPHHRRRRPYRRHAAGGGRPPARRPTRCRRAGPWRPASTGWWPCRWHPTLHSRAIVTAANDVVEMDLSLNRDPREAALFADGELLSFDAPVKRVGTAPHHAATLPAVPTSTPPAATRRRHDGFSKTRHSRCGCSSKIGWGRDRPCRIGERPSIIAPKTCKSALLSCNLVRDAVPPEQSLEGVLLHHVFVGESQDRHAPM